MTEERVQRTIRRVLVAARGEQAGTLIELLEGYGVETVAVFDASDAEAPHLDTASWAVPLPEHSPEHHASVLCDQALDAGADAVLPGPFTSKTLGLAGDAAAARTVGACGLAWLGPGPTWIERAADVDAARQAAGVAGLPVVHPGSAHGDAGLVEVALLGDGAQAAAWADARVGASWTTSPSGLASQPRGTLLAGAAAWATRSGLAGPAVARFVVDASGVPRADALLPGLPTWHALVAVDDRPLALAALRILAGQDVPSPPDAPPDRVAVEIRLRAVAEGLLEELETPDGARATLGAAPGQQVLPGDVLCVLRVEGPDAPSARRAAREAVAATGVHGVATDAQALCEALAAAPALGASATGLC